MLGLHKGIGLAYARKAGMSFYHPSRSDQRRSREGAMDWDLTRVATVAEIAAPLIAVSGWIIDRTRLGRANRELNELNPSLAVLNSYTDVRDKLFKLMDG